MTKPVSIEVKFAQVAQALACDAKQSVTLIRMDLPKIQPNLGIAALIRLTGGEPPEGRFTLYFKYLRVHSSIIAGRHGHCLKPSRGFCV